MEWMRWSRRELLARLPASIPESLLGATALVLDGITAADDEALAWCRWAPCPVIAVGSAIASPTAVDVIAPDEASVESLVTAAEANPHAARVLVEVLRLTPSLPVRDGLQVESMAYSMLLASPEFARWLGGRRTRAARSFVGSPVATVRSESTLTVTLQRPENRNAFSAAMRDALFEALSVPLIDPTIDAVVIDGHGPVFSSGGDVDEFGTSPDVAHAHAIRVDRSVGRLVAEMAAAVSFRVHGRCVGAGVELPAFGERIVAAPDTTFRLPEIAMGLIPGAGGTVSISRRIGRQRTAELALTGREMDVAEAMAIGLVDEVSASH